MVSASIALSLEENSSYFPEPVCKQLADVLQLVAKQGVAVERQIPPRLRASRAKSAIRISRLMNGAISDAHQTFLERSLSEMLRARLSTSLSNLLTKLFPLLGSRIGGLLGDLLGFFAGACKRAASSFLASIQRSLVLLAWLRRVLRPGAACTLPSLAFA